MGGPLRGEMLTIHASDNLAFLNVQITIRFHFRLIVFNQNQKHNYYNINNIMPVRMLYRNKDDLTYIRMCLRGATIK